MAHRKIVPDLLSEGTATALARRIEAYWFARGYCITAWIERFTPSGEERHSKLYAVRSNLVNGLPDPKIHPLVLSTAR